MKFNCLLLLLLPVFACKGKYTTSATNSAITTTFLRQLGSVSAAGTSGMNDECHASAVDSAGNSYCAGFTEGTLGDTNAGGGLHGDSFIMKVDSNGEVVWITQFGTTTQPPGNAQAHTSDDRCKGITVDASGNVYCAGYAAGNMGEAHDPSSSEDPFVTKLDSNGNVLWVTQLGATTIANSNAGLDSCWSVAVDSSGNVFCGGTTSGDLGELSGGGNDAFVMKLSSSGALLWVKQLGSVTAPGAQSALDDYCVSIAVDSSGNVYCGGQTQSNLGDTNAGGDDAFIAKFSADGATVPWITQLGTTKGTGTKLFDDTCYGVAVDGSGNVFCAGETKSDMGAETSNAGSKDVFVMKVNSSGIFQWVNHLGNLTGTSAAEGCQGVATDSSGNVYCGGYTNGNLGETSGGSVDAFVLKMNGSGVLQWITQLGNTTEVNDNSGVDVCYGVSVDSAGSVYCAGFTDGAIAEASGGNNDAFLLKLNTDGVL